MAANRDRGGQTMRTELAASCACAEKASGLLICRGGRRVAYRIFGSEADTAATTEKYRPIRSTTDRIAPAGCAALKEGSYGLFERASTSSSLRIDACWARGRFHACRTCARAPSRLPANYARPDYPQSRNRGFTVASSRTDPESVDRRAKGPTWDRA